MKKDGWTAIDLLCDGLEFGRIKGALTEENIRFVEQAETRPILGEAFRRKQNRLWVPEEEAARARTIVDQARA